MGEFILRESLKEIAGTEGKTRLRAAVNIWLSVDDAWNQMFFLRWTTDDVRFPKSRSDPDEEREVLAAMESDEELERYVCSGAPDRERLIALLMFGARARLGHMVRLFPYPLSMLVLPEHLPKE